MTAIQNLTHEPTACKFSLNYTIGSSCKTVPFILNKQWKKCHLTFSVIGNGYQYQYNGNFTLEFEEKFALGQNQSFQLIAHFNESILGYAFMLNKINDNTFQSQSAVIRTDNISTNYSYPLRFTIIFPIVKSDLLKQHMNGILQNETYSDVKLVADDKIFNVHKNIISGRNKVLAKMIEDMVKKEVDTICLPGWDPVIVQELLNFIYTEECDVTNNPHELFKLSHFLQIKELQILCKDYIISNIKNENLTKALELTKQSQYELKDLDNATKEFIKKNESTLATNLDFINCLSNSININNVTYVLQFSNQYNIDSLTSTAMKYVFSNYKQVFHNKECKKYLSSNPDLMFDVFEYILDKQNTTSDAKI